VIVVKEYETIHAIVDGATEEQLQQIWQEVKDAEEKSDYYSQDAVNALEIQSFLKEPDCCYHSTGEMFEALLKKRGFKVYDYEAMYPK